MRRLQERYLCRVSYLLQRLPRMSIASPRALLTLMKELSAKPESGYKNNLKLKPQCLSIQQVVHILSHLRAGPYKI
jgi:hypothetical protein